MTAFRLEDVWFAYGNEPVLRGVTLEVQAGEAVALLGANGVGKTTLTKLLVALLHPNRGRVWVGGRTTQGQMPEDMSRRVAYVFQHPDQQLFARTLFREVAFAPLQQGLSPDDAAVVAERALRNVGLDALAEEHPYDLPPAQRKLVALAAAMAQQPRVLVLDEPAQGLDRAGVRRVVGLLRRAVGDGVAVLAVTHDLALVAEALERCVVLAEGRVAYDGPSRDLLWDPARLDQLGLATPPAVEVARALRLEERPVRVREVVAGLRGLGGG